MDMHIHTADMIELIKITAFLLDVPVVLEIPSALPVNLLLIPPAI